MEYVITHRAEDLIKPIYDITEPHVSILYVFLYYIQHFSFGNEELVFESKTLKILTLPNYSIGFSVNILQP